MIARMPELDALVAGLHDEADAEMAAALHVVQTVDDVDALRQCGIDAVLAGRPSEVLAMVQGRCAPFGWSVVLVGDVDAGLGAMIEDEVPGVPVRSMREQRSPARTLGYVGTITRWTEAEACERRRTWLELARSAMTERPTSIDAAGEERAPFPVDCLPATLRAMVTEGAASQGVDPSFWSVPLLAILGGCIGATRSVRLKSDWHEPAVLWTAVVAPSGAGKSPAMRSLLQPVRDHDYELHVRTVAAIQRHEAELEQWKQAREGDGEKPVAPPMLGALLDDATMEAVGARLNDNPRGLLLACDELAGFLRGFNRYRSGGDEQAWLSIHGAGPIKVDRKAAGNRIYVRCAAVSVTGTIQPMIARRYLGAAEQRASGLCARLLLAAPPVVPAKWTDREIDGDVRQSYGVVIRSLLGLQLDGEGQPVAVRLDDDARAAFILYHDQNGIACANAAGSGEGDLAAALAKLRGAAPRIALALTLARAAEEGMADHAASIGRQTMLDAITIARWFEGEARRIYGQWSAADAEDHAATERGSLTALAERVRKALARGPQSIDELHKATGRNHSSARLRAALSLLGATCEKVPPARGGRPKEMWQLAEGVSS